MVCIKRHLVMRKIVPDTLSTRASGWHPNVVVSDAYVRTESCVLLQQQVLLILYDHTLDCMSPASLRRQNLAPKECDCYLNRIQTRWETIATHSFRTTSSTACFVEAVACASIGRTEKHVIPGLTYPSYSDI